MRSIFPIYLPLLVVIIIMLARRPADMLRRRGAVSPDTAQPLDGISARDRRRLERLIAEGRVREASPGLYYFDRETERARLRQRMPWLIALIVVLALAGIAMFWFGRGVMPTP